MSCPDLTMYQAYHVTTTAGREFDLLFSGRTSTRLIFHELDGTMTPVLLKPRWIKSATPIGAQR